MNTIGFLELPPVTPEAQALFDEDIAEDGYVMNVTKLWSHHPALVTNLFDLMGQAVADQDLSFRQRAILVAACASTVGDSYCSLAWGSKLARVSDPDLAAAVIRGPTTGWARTSAPWHRGHARSRVIPTTPRRGRREPPVCWIQRRPNLRHHGLHGVATCFFHGERCPWRGSRRRPAGGRPGGSRGSHRIRTLSAEFELRIELRIERGAGLQRTHPWDNPRHGRAAGAAGEPALEDGRLGPPGGVRRTGRRHLGPHCDVDGIHAVGPGRRRAHLAGGRRRHVDGVLLVPA